MKEKKRNKYFEREKERLRLQDESWELSKQIRNQSLVELEKPIPVGWVASWDLRDDIKRRKDSWVYYDILRLVNQSVTSRRKDFRFKPYKSKSYQTILPSKRKITSDEYDRLKPQVQKHFSLHYDSKSFRKYYYCDITYEFVVKIKRDYITHYQEHDEVLVQRKSEVDDKLHQITYNIGWGYNNYNCPKWYRKCVFGGVKTKDTKNIRNLVKTYNGHEDYQDGLIDNIVGDFHVKNQWW